MIVFEVCVAGPGCFGAPGSGRPCLTCNGVQRAREPGSADFLTAHHVRTAAPS